MEERRSLHWRDLRLALRLELVEVRENGVELLGDGGLAASNLPRHSLQIPESIPARPTTDRFRKIRQVSSSIFLYMNQKEGDTACVY